MDALTPARIAARLRAGATPEEEPVERPSGHLIWVHAPGGVPAAPLIGLSDRLAARIGPVRILVTGVECPQANALIYRPAPDEAPDAVAHFLDHWRPDAALWIGDTHGPLLLDGAARSGLPLILVNATTPPSESSRARRIRRLLLRQFTHILARNAAAGSALLDIDRSLPLSVTGPLSQLSRPLEYAETDREEFAEAIAVRPVWLAIAPTPEELEAVLQAHGSALRGAHRLLLLLVPGNPEDGPALTQTLRSMGWSVSRRSSDELPGKSDEIYVADSVEDMGLWYRLAPLCFIGGSLSTGAIRDPMEAAALGSAIIAGPVGGLMTRNLEGLDKAGALRRITGPEMLGRAVADLMSPDRAATLAHRAWDVATDGAEVEERLAQLIIDAVSRGTL